MSGINNPAAFPAIKIGSSLSGDDVTIHCPGMTLRDYFAGQIIVGMPFNPAAQWTIKEHVEDCFRIADEMLAERLKGKNEKATN